MSPNYHEITNRQTIEKNLEKRNAPKIIECKKTVWGTEILVDCWLIQKRSYQIILFHPLEQQWDIDGFIIQPPMFTIASYWLNRSYNIYSWFTPGGSYIASYFNVVELPGYEFSNNVLTYHDLVLDILLRKRNKPVLLDKEELSQLDNIKSRRALLVSESILNSATQIIREKLTSLPHWLKEYND